MTTTALPRHRAITGKGTLLIACIAVSFVPGLIGGRFKPDAWYAALDKSSLTPPGFVFPIVWTILYAAMGVALWLFLRARPRHRVLGASLFGLQLVLNGSWSYLFFGLHRPDLSLIDIGALWLAIVGVMIVFARTSRSAALLLAPYLAWVTFATYLNAAVL
ncbi:MAG TPA: TspO/MBR family protein [Kofleriaceae bacterium]|jgi:tryptophan-rich sensory protein|nr:TspO/MBR family protein [Kofleriaceae bacterium]